MAFCGEPFRGHFRPDKYLPSLFFLERKALVSICPKTVHFNFSGFASISLKRVEGKFIYQNTLIFQTSIRFRHLDKERLKIEMPNSQPTSKGLTWAILITPIS